MDSNTESGALTSRRNAMQSLLTGAALLGGVAVANAKLETYQTPTAMTLAFTTTSAKRLTRVTARAKLTRIDTDAGVGSAEIQFYFGSPRYPTAKVGTKYTNTAGEAEITFTVSREAALGRNVVVAQFLGNNRFAQPLPYSFINITA